MSTWSIFKFGGASVKDPEALRNAVRLVRAYGTHPLLVVVSAMGKTTNALERYIEARELGDTAAASTELDGIKAFHGQMARDLGPARWPRGTEPARVAPPTETPWGRR